MKKALVLTVMLAFGAATVFAGGENCKKSSKCCSKKAKTEASAEKVAKPEAKASATKAK